MSRSVLLLLAAGFLVGALGRDDPGYKTPTAEVLVRASNASLSKLFAEPAAFGRDIWNTDAAPQWELEGAGTLCDGAVHGSIPSERRLPSDGKDRAVLAERGDCSFSEKAANAEEAGFGVLLVRNTIPSLYKSYAASVNQTVETLPVLRVARCDTDCRKKTSTWIPSSEVTLPAAMRGFNCGCSFGENMCVLTGDVRNRTRSDSTVVQEHRVCCAADDMLVMGSSSASSSSLPKPSIRLASLTIAGGRELVSAANRSASSSVHVVLQARPYPTVDPAVGVLWLIAITTVTVGSWIAARRDRMRASQDPLVRAAAEEEEREAVEHGEVLPEAISITQGLCFLGIAATFLIMLFLLIRLGIGIVYIFLGLFIIGSASAVSVLLVQPVLKRFGPARWQVDFQGPCRQDCNAAEIISWLVGLSFSLLWFFFRHRSLGWLGQNFFAALLCLLFFSQIKLSSLRVATIMGGLFIAYDVFMVFLTPYIFGSSVMMDVATAGRPESGPNQYCYCRLHPDDAKRCGPGEVMPILLRAPRLVDYRGGESLLGLGDIVLPGLVLSLALRHDYVFFRTWSAGAWIATVIGYAVGLSLANIAVVAMHQGQPALLYLLPMVLGSLALIAYCRGTLSDLWRGIQRRPRGDDGPLDDSELPLALAGEQRDVEEGTVHTDESQPLQGGRREEGREYQGDDVHRNDRRGSGGAFRTGEGVQVELTAFSPEERDGAPET